MTILDLEVLKASVVIAGLQLLPNDAQLLRFRDALGSEVVLASGGAPPFAPGFSLDVGFGAGVAEASFGERRSFTIGRDRITFDVNPMQSAVVREYPQATDIGRLAEAIGLALEITDPDQAQTYPVGYNIELVYGQDSEPLASAYLAQRLFRGLSAIGDWNIAAGAGTLSFATDHGGTFNLTAEPRFREASTSRIFIGANLHRFETGALRDAEIDRHLSDALEKTQQFVELLDREESQ
ncbi:MAG: hypothetical protein OXG27_14550 [Chloroflexi bacterium]|nr:hypothetical protein [Chloroflexota bacterium]